MVLATAIETRSSAVRLSERLQALSAMMLASLVQYPHPWKSGLARIRQWRIFRMQRGDSWNHRK